MKTRYIIGSALAAVVAVGMSIEIGNEIMNEIMNRWAVFDQERENEVIRHNYAHALGYDVRLGKSVTDSGIIFGIGTLDDRCFNGAAILARDYNNDGIVDDFSCSNVPGRCTTTEDLKLHHSCDATLLKLMDITILNKIERELLPYYGKDKTSK